MSPGDRIMHTHSGRRGFVLYESNTTPGDYMIRFDGVAYNSLVDGGQYEVLPTEPFRPKPVAPTVMVKFHVAVWPYNHTSEQRSTQLHGVPSRWVPTVGAIVDEITVR